MPLEPIDFIRESAGPDARFFRAADDALELFVALSADGRIRISDGAQRRFAGTVTRERGEVLEIGSNRWSRVFIRESPGGKTQIELHGGPYDAHVLTCEALPV